MSEDRPLKVAVVGPCTAGKSTLVTALNTAGYDAHHVAQEHSYVRDLWQRFTKPDVLIYLDVTYPVAQKRRNIEWGPERLEEEAGRLAHAREYCDLYLLTDEIPAERVYSQVISFLSAWK
jgi:deoxyadenosine/deoxycytidine kinase